MNIVSWFKGSNSSIIHVLVLICVLFFLGGCGSMGPTGDEKDALVGDSFHTSQEIDELQAKLSPYSESSEALAELDNIQREIRFGLNGNADVIDLPNLYDRCKKVYKVLREEIITNWDTIPAADQAKITDINEQILQLNGRVVELMDSKATYEKRKEVLGKVVSITKFAVKSYKTYKDTTD